MITLGALAIAFAGAATVVSANASPAQIEARATGSSSGSLPTITTKGNAFWNGNERFYLRGIDYQPGGSSGDVGSDGATDPLAELSTCSRDIPYFQKLGLNTVRVYTVDNSKNHDDCMNALAAAGIYLVLDVNTPDYSLNRESPGPSYNPTYLQSVFATIDAFAGYSNTLAFFSGNEVLNAPNTSDTAPFVKAVNRDMKQYIGEQGYRQIPVGYSAADVTENQYLMAQYLDCGSDAERADFYAINNYQWCGQVTFDTSGWDILVDQYKNYSLPMFFSEYGCIAKVTRTFTETTGLYQTDMTGVFSGGLVYEYAEEESNPGYGVVNLQGNNVNVITAQFNDLQKALAGVSNPSGDGGYSANNPPQECPGPSEYWDIKPFSGSSLPATPSGALKYFKNGAGKGPGLTGDGSQNAPGGSSETASPNAGQVTATYGTGSGGATSTGSSSSSSSSGAAVAISRSQTNLLPIMASAAVVLVSFGCGMALF